MAYYRENRKEKKAMKINVIKVAGVIATVGGAALSVLGSWAGEKQQEQKIAEKVAEAISKSTKEN